jgi:HEAT repeat protein
MIRYCPDCWAENAYKATICTTCGASLDETGKDFTGRLMDAVGHPEPTRAVIAAEILGRLRKERAVEPLLTRLARKPDSMDVTTAVAAALGQIGDQQAVPGLAGVLLDGERPLPARLAAAEALDRLGGPVARQALADTQALPQLPRLLRRLIESRLTPTGVS